MLPTEPCLMDDDRSLELPRRLSGLDVLRALAAWAVVFAHILKWPWAFAGQSGPIGEVWRFIIHTAAGRWGVGVFFVLSGTCIHLPIARRLVHEAAPSLDLREYFRRRFWRIYPPHLLIIFLSWATAILVVLPHDFDPLVTTPTSTQFWAHIGLVHTFVPGASYSINVVLWSIALEAHFYLLYPLLLWLRRRVRMEAICLALFALMLGLQLLDRVLPPSLSGLLTYSFLGRWWEWVVGAIVAERLVRGHRLRIRWPLALALAIGSEVVVTIATNNLPHGVVVAAVTGPWLYGVVVFGCALMAVPDRPGLVRALEWIGIRSYSLYLAHPIALTLVAFFVAGSGWVQTAAAIVAAHLAGWIYFVVVESRFMPTRRANTATQAGPAPMQG
jgi:peptidoglycan/LPS O-acetylase OafA/YrhL